MRLRRLLITGFGGLRDCVIEFGDGITVLHGPNEAGKSTVLHCIAQVLYGRPSQRSLFPDFTPWDGGEFAATLEFARDGGLFRLTRRFQESGPRAVVLHQLREDGSERLVTREASEVRAWVADAFGTADDRIFYRVFCLTQADLHPLDNYSGLREQLERAASGAEVAVAAAIQRIDARLAELRRGVGQPALRQNWGPLKRAEEARKERESRLHEARRQQKRLTEVRESAQQLGERIAQATARSEEIDSFLEQEQHRRESTMRLQELRIAWGQQEEGRERMERLQLEHDRLQAFLAAQPAVLADPRPLRNRLAREEQAARSGQRWRYALTLVGSIIAAAVALSVSNVLIRSLAALIAVAGIFFVIWLLASTRKSATLFAELHVADGPEALRRLADIEQAQHDLAATRMALDTLAGTMADVDQRRSLAQQIATLEEKIAQYPGQPISAEEAHRLSREMQALCAELPDWQAQERSVMRELAVLEDAERDLIDLEDAFAYWRQEEARAREEEQVLLLARELLVQAGQRTHQGMADPLAAQISPLFAAMTGERYPRVRVTGDARSLEVCPEDATGIPIPPEQLSKGTQDQFMLAVRLALGMVIAGRNGSPVFLLDDPLLHFDVMRREEAVAMLRQFSTQAQIILATHDATAFDALPETCSVAFHEVFLRATGPCV